MMLYKTWHDVHKEKTSKKDKRTAYEKWRDGELPGQGSFHSALLNLYGLASGVNKEKLRKAFPEWFGTKKID